MLGLRNVGGHVFGVAGMISLGIVSCKATWMKKKYMWHARLSYLLASEAGNLA